MFPYPTEEELKSYYENDYTNMKIEGTGLHIRFKDEYFSTYSSGMDLTFSDLELNLKEYEGKTLLDIGCANGIFLKYLQNFNIDGLGIDISRDMVEDAKKHGLNCISGNYEKLEGKFDIVTIWDVIEHVTDPNGLLEKVYSLLKKDGLLLIQTPCTGIISDEFGKDWRNYIVPQHIFLFSKDSLLELLEKKGFRVEKWFRMGSGNTAGSIPPLQKGVFDRIAKKLKIGDTITLKARKI